MVFIIFLLYSLDRNFSQILREINFGESRRPETAILWTFNLDYLANDSLQKVKKLLQT